MGTVVGQNTSFMAEIFILDHDIIIYNTSVSHYNAQPFKCPLNFIGSKSEKYERIVPNQLISYR